MRNQVQLITYADRLSGKGIHELSALLCGSLAKMFGGIHLLPFFYPIDGADAGFDPIDHTTVDPQLGTWDELHDLGAGLEVVADLIVNHISNRSPQFPDWDLSAPGLRHAWDSGDRSPFHGWNKSAKTETAGSKEGC